MKLSEALGLALPSQSTDSAEIVVLYTGHDLTPAALEAARKLTDGLNFRLVLLAVHIVPYPLQLRALGTIEDRLRAELEAMAAASSLPVSARIVFARDINDAFRQFVRPESLVLIASRKRWWRTRPDRWAKELAARGFRTALVHL